MSKYSWIWFIVISLIVIFSIYFIFRPSIQLENELKVWCNENGININECLFPSFTDCYSSCKSFNMSYMKIESGGFGMDNTNCWCKLNNTTRQIW